MNHNDFISRFLFDEKPIRGEYVHLQKSYQTILAQHNYPPPLRRILGEALAVAALLAAIIKFEGRLSVQFRGAGNLKFLLAQCDNQFNLRGLAKWQGEITEDVLSAALKEGLLVIMIDSPNNKKPYQGIVAWRGDSLLASIEGYFRDSEQLATKLWLAVDEKQAVGVLLQILPTKHHADDFSIEDEQLLAHWHSILGLTTHLNTEDLLSLDYPDLLKKTYSEEMIRIFPSEIVRFGCSCSRERSEDAIYLLGWEEAEDELNKKKTLVVTCDFCNQAYFFDRAEVTAVFARKDNPPNKQLH